MSALAILARRELALAWGRGGGPLLALAFLAVATAATALASGPAVRDLAPLSGGAAFVALALASLLSLDRLFARDLESGALDILALGPLPFEVVAAVKCAAQWLAIGAPLALGAPLSALALGGGGKAAPMIAATAAVAGVAFSFVGGLGAAVALVSKRGGLLLAVIVLPLVTPPIIFGGVALRAAASGLEATTAFALLSAYALAAAGLAPFAMAAACRNALS